ncbi:ABC transporter permease [Niallia endozanthoxylica]|uniref:ABC transporter permease n=1 Tax=Niallia endozanthoxylica TaxID=2036016 RepID=A0A5J5HIA6_9BACI|nr:ABC transporter permease [Niallia endozanthoxylica]KAA9020011.1 ABC transporter permease [Niallia endozanthoxylica]
MKKRYLAILLVLLSCISLFIGVSGISPFDIFRMTEEEATIFFSARVPRLVSIIIAGVAMSISGLIMQQLSHNKFVSPTTAGTEDSARFGILIAMMFIPAAGLMVKMSLAFVFALLGTFIFMKILDKVKLKDAVFIPLVGLMFGNIITSMTTFFAYKNDLIQNMTAWLQGNFSMTVKGQYELIYISIPLVLISYLFANKFTVAGMGEEFAVNLGLKYKQVVNIGLSLVAMMSAVVILTAGMIPFLGLIIPNIVSIYNGDHLQKNLSHTALLGAVFILACDIFGRLIIYPYEIPIGLTVGVIGSGVFIYLLLRRKAYA